MAKDSGPEAGQRLQGAVAQVQAEQEAIDNLLPPPTFAGASAKPFDWNARIAANRVPQGYLIVKDPKTGEPNMVCEEVVGCTTTVPEGYEVVHNSNEGNFSLRKNKP